MAAVELSPGPQGQIYLQGQGCGSSAGQSTALQGTTEMPAEVKLT